MSQWAVFTLLSYLTLVPMCWYLRVSLRPPRLRAPVVFVDPLTLTSDSELDTWGLY